MKLWVGVTDNEWFEFLAQRNAEEANFWRPRSTVQFRVLEPGGLFLFKLHSPQDYIVGGGHFVCHSILPLSLAWETFKEANGAGDVGLFRQLIQKTRRDSERDPQIGCTILNHIFYFQREKWIPVPASFHKNLVQGKSYDTDADLDGRVLWAEVQERLIDSNDWQQTGASLQQETPRYGEEYLARARLGQGAFRVLVTDAYSRRCALTGERTLPVLQAAHIKPYAQNGEHNIKNGLLMRSDLHILFDKGYVTVTPDYHIEVSKNIREEFQNGRDYYALHGKTLVVMPGSPTLQPSQELLKWHNETCFLA